MTGKAANSCIRYCDFFESLAPEVVNLVPLTQHILYP